MSKRNWSWIFGLIFLSIEWLVEHFQFKHKGMGMAQFPERGSNYTLNQKFKEETILHMKTRFHFRPQVVTKSEKDACSGRSYIFNKQIDRLFIWKHMAVTSISIKQHSSSISNRNVKATQQQFQQSSTWRGWLLTNPQDLQAGLIMTQATYTKWNIGAIIQTLQLKITPFSLKFPNNYGKNCGGRFCLNYLDNCFNSFSASFWRCQAWPPS